MSFTFHHALGGTDFEGGIEQNPQELAMLADFITKKRIASFLEIGLAKGDLQRYMMELGLQCFGVTPYKKDSHEGLTVIYGKSQDGHVIEKVKEFLSRVTPSVPNPEPRFDMILVDGDHSYEGVRADYKNYKGMCRYMAFHDVLGKRDCEGVLKLWSEVKYNHKYLTFIADNQDHASGIGIIIME